MCALIYERDSFVNVARKIVAVAPFNLYINHINKNKYSRVRIYGRCLSRNFSRQINVSAK